MGMICIKSSSWVVQDVLQPIDDWVQKTEQKCKKWPWPLNWICDAVTFLVKVTIWITIHITVEVNKFICTVITGLIGLILYPFAAAIDSLCQKCYAMDWVKYWWLTIPRIEFVSSTPSADPGLTDYTFICHCRKDGDKNLVVTAKNQDEAAEMAKEECAKACG